MIVGCGIIFLISLNNFQKNTTAEIGYGLAKLASSGGVGEDTLTSGLVHLVH